MRIEFSPKFRTRFRLGRKLGAGAMGVVYAAMDKTTDEQVAIKVLNPKLLDSEGIARFVEEARVTSTLDHPGIVKLYESGFDGETPYMVFELIKGFSLRRYIRAKKHISVRKTLLIGQQIAMALDYAHQKGVIHRDIKPDNILIAGKDLIKLADFGIARALSRRSCKTKTGLVLGTVAYMAPEQISEMNLTPSVDIYGLGVVLYECLSGRQPFKGKTIEVAAAQIKQKPPPISNKDLEDHPEVATLIEWALKKDPKERIPSAIVFAQRLETILDTMGQEKEKPSLFSSSSQAGMMLKEIQEAEPRDFESVDGINIPTGGSNIDRSATLRLGTNGMIQVDGPEEPGKFNSRILMALLAILVGLTVLYFGWQQRPRVYTYKDLKVTTGTDRAEIRWSSDNRYPSVIEFSSSNEGPWQRALAAAKGPTKKHRVLIAGLRAGNWSYRIVFPDKSKSLAKEFSLSQFGGPQVVAIKRLDPKSIEVEVKNSVPLDGTVVFKGSSEKVEKRLEKGINESYSFFFEDSEFVHHGATLSFEWRVAGKGATKNTTDIVVPSFADQFRKELNDSRAGPRVMEIARESNRNERRTKLRALFRELETTSIGLWGRDFLLFTKKYFGPNVVPFKDRLAFYEELTPWLFLEESAPFLDGKVLFSAKKIRANYNGWVIESDNRTKLPLETQLVSKKMKLDLTQTKRSTSIEFQLPQRPSRFKKEVVLSVRYRVLSRHTYVKVRVNSLCSLYLAESSKMRKPKEKDVKGMLVQVSDRDYITEAFFLPEELFKWNELNELQLQIGRWPCSDNSPFYGALIGRIEVRIEAS